MALNAVLLFHLMQQQGEIDHCEKLLSEIVQQKQGEKNGNDAAELRELSGE